MTQDKDWQENHTEDLKVSPEYWIIKEQPYSTWVSDKPLYSADTDQEIHVIEYSEYEKLQSRIKQLEKELADLRFIYEDLCR